MRAVLQRVRQASVVVAGEEIARIGKGMLLLVAVERGDPPQAAEDLARRVSQIRIFEDGEGKMNLSASAAGAEVLVVPQFTLAADLRKGTRPSFDPAEEPEKAQGLMSRLTACLRAAGLPVAEGRFGARMEVHLVNDGPATFVL